MTVLSKEYHPHPGLYRFGAGGPAVRIDATSWKREVTILHPTGERVSLAQMQEAVGGYIEHVGNLQEGAIVFIEGFPCIEFPDGADVYANDESKLLGMEPNWLASALCGYLGSGDTINGPIVILPYDRSYEEA